MAASMGSGDELLDPDEARRRIEQIMREMNQRLAHLRERKELRDEVADEQILQLSAVLAQLKAQGKPLSAAVRVIRGVADDLPEDCHLTAAAAIHEFADGEGHEAGDYDAERMRGHARQFRLVASRFDLLAELLDHEAEFPYTD